MKYHTPLVKRASAPSARDVERRSSPVMTGQDRRSTPMQRDRDRNSRRARAVAYARIEKGSAPCDAKLQPGMATTEAEILAREAAHPTAPPVVEFRRVSKRYDNGMGLDDASFTVGRGEFVFLVGSTGSGKSTVMRLLIKELEPTSGSIRVAGRDLAEITRKKVPFFRRNLGVVFQDYKLLPNRTVHDNVAYALQVTGSSRKEVRAKVPDILRLTGPVDQAAPLPRPALRRRAAARLGGARVRQPPAAAAGRRADRQPRSRDLDRDHAAAVPHQPHGDDGHRRHPRLGHGRPHAPARDRALAAGASSATRSRASTRRATCRPPSSARSCASRRPRPGASASRGDEFDEAFRD